VARKNNTPGWYNGIFEDGSSLNFWFDFIPCSGDFAKYSIQNIGHRPKISN